MDNSFNIPDFINSARQQGINDEDTLNYLRSKGLLQNTSSNQPTQNTQDNTDNRGFFEKLVKGPIESLAMTPANRVATAVTSGVAKVFGTPEQQQKAYQVAQEPLVMDVPFLGQFRTEGSKPFGEGGVAQAFGDTLNAGSYLIPADKFANAGASMFKGEIGKSIGAGMGAGLQYGMMQGASDNLRSDKPTTLWGLTGDTLSGGLGGAITGGVLSGAGAGVSKAVRGSISGVNNISNKGVVNSINDSLASGLSKTTEIPMKAWDILSQREPTVNNFINNKTTKEEALVIGQNAVKNLRKSLTNEWQSSTDNIIKEFDGKRALIPENVSRNLYKIADDYNFEKIPQNIKSISANEAFPLMEEINTYLSKKGFVNSPEGAKMGMLHDQLKKIFVDSFGGRGGSFDTLYSNYSRGKRILDNSDLLLKAYENNPKTLQTAQNALMNIFNEDKNFYLKTLVNLEKETGLDILSPIVSLHFQKQTPKYVFKTTGVPVVDEVFRKVAGVLTAPLRNPSFAKYLYEGAKEFERNIKIK